LERLLYKLLNGLLYILLNGLLYKLLNGLLIDNRFGNINILVYVDFDVVWSRNLYLHRDGYLYLVRLRNGNLNLVRYINPDFIRFRDRDLYRNGLLYNLFVGDGVGNRDFLESFDYLYDRYRNFLISGNRNLIRLRNIDLYLYFNRVGDLNVNFDREGNLNALIHEHFIGNRNIDRDLTLLIIPNLNGNRNGNFVRSGDRDSDLLRLRIHLTDNIIWNGVGNLDVGYLVELRRDSNRNLTSDISDNSNRYRYTDSHFIRSGNRNRNLNSDRD